MNDSFESWLMFFCILSAACWVLVGIAVANDHTLFAVLLVFAAVLSFRRALALQAVVALTPLLYAEEAPNG